MCKFVYRYIDIVDPLVFVCCGNVVLWFGDYIISYHSYCLYVDFEHGIIRYVIRSHMFSVNLVSELVPVPDDLFHYGKYVLVGYECYKPDLFFVIVEGVFTEEVGEVGENAGLDLSGWRCVVYHCRK